MKGDRRNRTRVAVLRRLALVRRPVAARVGRDRRDVFSFVEKKSTFSHVRTDLDHLQLDHLDHLQLDHLDHLQIDKFIIYISII